MKYVTYRQFNDPGMAEQLTGLLKDNNIEFEIEDNSPGFDPAFAYNVLNSQIAVKIAKEDFAIVNDLLNQLNKQEIDSVDSNYYLFQFSDDELLDIITKRDEWNHFDFQLAQKILNDRGKEITPEVIELLGRQRIRELSKTEEGQENWIRAGYLFAIIGGIIGIFIGFHLYTHKKTLPNGERVYGFNSQDRKNGLRIFFIGIVMTIIWTIIKYKYE